MAALQSRKIDRPEISRRELRIVDCISAHRFLEERRQCSSIGQICRRHAKEKIALKGGIKREQMFCSSRFCRPVFRTVNRVVVRAAPDLHSTNFVSQILCVRESLREDLPAEIAHKAAPIRGGLNTARFCRTIFRMQMKSIYWLHFTATRRRSLRMSAR